MTSTNSSTNLPAVVSQLSNTLQETFRSREKEKSREIKGQKKRKLPSKVFSNLSLEIWLIALEIRTAHLVDSFQPTRVDCFAILDALKKFESLSEVSVLIEPQSEQVFLFNRKLTSETDSESELSSRKFIDVRKESKFGTICKLPPISLCRKVESLSSYSRQNSQTQREYKVLSMQRSLQVLSTKTSLSTDFAGYLLEYPFVYVMEDGDDEKVDFRVVEEEDLQNYQRAREGVWDMGEASENNLAGQDLVLFECSVSNDEALYHPLRSFTVPRDCLSAEDVDLLKERLLFDLASRREHAFTITQKLGDEELQAWVFSFRFSIQISSVNLDRLAL